MADREYPYYLVRTAFHGGGLISRHWSLEGAEKAQKKHQSSECLCGCAKVIPAEDYRDLPDAFDCTNPYAAARR